MLSTCELKGVFAKYGFKPLKRLGENYLIDGNIKDKIIEASALVKGDTVLEVGPGFGALTIDLAKSGADLYALEIDKKAISILRDIVGKDYPNLRLINGDILKFDIKSISNRHRIKVIGNLPYFITTPIIEHLIENRRYIESILVTVQREVANRLLASAGAEDYSSISCFVQYFAKPAYIHTIKRTSFYPVPEVDSSLIRLDVLHAPSVKVKDEGLFFRIIRGAFNQRRKSILNSLSRKAVLDISKARLMEVLHSAGIAPSARPETLSLSQFAAISNAVSS